MAQETKTYALPIFIFVATGFLFVSDDFLPQSNAGGIVVEIQAQFPVVPAEKPKSPYILQASANLPKVSAKAVLIKDPVSKEILYTKNGTATLPIASLTKLLTALVVKDRASLEEMVEIKPEDINVPPYKTNLQPPEKVLVKDLLEAMLVASANDAAEALARHVGGSTENFVSLMNRKARQLKMLHTSFQNPVGFDDKNHYSTAEDLSILVEEFVKDSDLMNIVGQKQAHFFSLDKGLEHRFVSTNKLLRNPEVLGIKTGYTNEAKGNIIIMVDPSETKSDLERYYFIILGSDNREADAEMLIDFVENNFRWQ